MATPNGTPDDSIDESTGFIIPKSQWLRVLLIAVVLPVLLTVVNDAITGRLPVKIPTTVVVVVFSIYIIEMTVAAMVAGAGIRQTWLAWMLFAWLLLMINMHLIVAAVGSSKTDLSIAAFAGAQLGFLVVWAAMGVEKWYQRLPVAFVIAGIVLYCWYHFVDTFGYHRWSLILFIELASIALLSIAFRLTGFRLHKLDKMLEGSAGKRVQFGLRHVLVFITVLAILLGAARAAQMLTMPFFLNAVSSLKLWRIVIAAPSAMLIVLAFWAALGKGSAKLKTALIAIGCLGIGFGMAKWLTHMLKTAGAPGFFFNRDLWQRRQFWELEYWWIAWYCLSTGLLVACLLFFRIRGYRIIRTRRTRSSA